MLNTVLRFVVAALILLLIGAVIPGFSVAGFGTAILTAIAIALLSWVAQRILGEASSPGNRGMVSFLATVAVIYAAQYFVAGFQATLLGAVLAALIMGFLDGLLPSSLR